MSMKPELMRPDSPPARHKEMHGPSWSAILTFVVGVFSMFSLVALVILGYRVSDLQADVKLYDIRVNNLANAVKIMDRVNEHDRQLETKLDAILLELRKDKK